MKKTLYLIMLLPLLLSCNKNQLVANKLTEISRPIADTVYQFPESSNLLQKEIVEYKYEKPNDIFWNQAIYKDTSNNVIRSIVRELDPASRLPVKEYTIDEFGETDEYDVVEYDPNTLLLKSKTTYKGNIAPENKVVELHYTYDDGVLISKTEKRYSRDKDYKNVDGTNITEESTSRFISDKSTRAKGLYETFSKIEKFKKYYTEELIDEYEFQNVKPGDIYYEEETKFDTKGNPVSYKSTNPEAGTEHLFNNEYYVIKSDSKGRITDLIPFANEKRDSIAINALMWKFYYDDKGMLSGVDEYMYNETTKAYDLIHGRERYTFHNVFSDIVVYNDISALLEGYCQHGQYYSKSEKTIEKFDKNTKTVLFKNVDFEGKYPEKEVPGKVYKKIVTKFETVKISK